MSLAAWLGWTPSVARARTPLPTVEVEQPPRRARLIDVRGPVRFGWGHSYAWRAPVYEVGFEAQASVLEISETTWLHLVFGESGQWTALPRRGRERPPGFLGLDLGVGLSRYAPGGPAFVIGVTAGPRWDNLRRDVRIDGFGIVGRADVYPFYGSIRELVSGDDGWFRKYVLSGAHLWALVRYDQLRAIGGHTYAAGVGLDFARTLILPLLSRLGRR